MIKAVLFDFGGVITTSPFDNFALLEQRVGAPADTIRKINSTNPDTNAWAQFERNDVDVVGSVNSLRRKRRQRGMRLMAKMYSAV